MVRLLEEVIGLRDLKLVFCERAARSIRLSRNNFQEMGCVLTFREVSFNAAERTLEQIWWSQYAGGRRLSEY